MIEDVGTMLSALLPANRWRERLHHRFLPPDCAQIAMLSRISIDFDSTQCHITIIDVEEPKRAFKAAWFSKATRKVRLKDIELCKALQEEMEGQADDLGSGDFKKRPDKSMHRSIILEKVADTGFSNICSQRRAGLTSRTTSLRIYVLWQRAIQR